VVSPRIVRAHQERPIVVIMDRLVPMQYVLVHPLKAMQGWGGASGRSRKNWILSSHDLVSERRVTAVLPLERPTDKIEPQG